MTWGRVKRLLGGGGRSKRTKCDVSRLKPGDPFYGSAAESNDRVPPSLQGLKSPNGRNVTKRAIIDVRPNSIVSGRSYDILTSIITQLLTFFECGVCAQSASEAIFMARTYDCITYSCSPVMMIT